MEKVGQLHPEGCLPGEDWPKKACYKCRGVSE